VLDCLSVSVRLNGGPKTGFSHPARAHALAQIFSAGPFVAGPVTVADLMPVAVAFCTKFDAAILDSLRANKAVPATSAAMTAISTKSFTVLSFLNYAYGASN
jgi:hypothetical protein